MKDNLLEICKKFIIESNDVVIAEPYIPYIPENWNGILVLSESQNLSKTFDDYVNKLNAMTFKNRIDRLYIGENLRVLPWDDGTLKLAVEAAFKVNADHTGVSNAVLWSQRNENGTNKNPSGFINEQSVFIWDSFLKIIKPKRIITVGKIARSIIKQTNWSNENKIRIIPLRSASKMALSRVSGMFYEDDLLKRYPEVNHVIENNKEWVKKFRLNKIFYACHAISINSKFKKIC